MNCDDSPKPDGGSMVSASMKIRRRRWHKFAMVICVAVLLWYGIALYYRVTHSWQVIHTIMGFVAYGAHCTEFSPDGGRIAISHSEHGKGLDWVNGKEISRLQQCGDRGVANFSSDGKIVSYFSDDNEGDRDACVWNAADGRVLGRLKLPGDAGIEGCFPFFSPDNKYIVAEYPDGVITWDFFDLAHIGRIKITRNKDPWLPMFLSWHPVSHEMTCADADGNLLKLDLRNETSVALLHKQETPMKAAQWSPDGKRLVTIDRKDAGVLIWDVQADTVITKLPAKDIMYACFSPTGDKVATMGKRTDVVHSEPTPRVWDRRTQIWDALSGKMMCELPTTGIVTFSPDWSYYVETGPEGVRISNFDNTESCTYSSMFDGHGSNCRFSPDNRYLARVNASGRVDVMKHNAPIRSWIELVTLYQFWMLVAAIAGLTWIVSKRISRTSHS
jgi:WD40 repeat protein